VRLSWRENVYSLPLYRSAIFTHKAGQTGLVCGVQDYKSLCNGYDLCNPG